MIKPGKFIEIGDDVKSLWSFYGLGCYSPYNEQIQNLIKSINVKIVRSSDWGLKLNLMKLD